MFLKPGAVIIERGIMGLDTIFSMNTRSTRKTAEVVNIATLLPPMAELPSVAPRTNKVAEVAKAPSPK